MLRLAVLLISAAGALSAQFLEFQIRFDAGGCVSCAESLKGRMQRVRGIETVTLDLERGMIRLELAADNRVRLVPLMSRIEQGGARALETKLKAKGVVVEDGSGQKLELQGAATGQTYILGGDTHGLQGPVVVEAELLDGTEGRLEILSIRPAE